MIRFARTRGLFEDVRDAAMTSTARLFRPQLITLGDDRDDVLTGFAARTTIVGFAGSDILTGGARRDILIGGEGADTLNGGASLDMLRGGLGNDTYIDPAGDTIAELASGGIDTVESARTYSLAALDHVENITLTGTATIHATGNGLANLLTGNAGRNRLDGGAGADTLSGGAGVDTLTGGAGDDTYVDTAGDVIVELAGGGTDTVFASGQFSLAALANVENVTLTGTANANAIGNRAANLLIGNDGANRLRGGLGADTLDGGAGNDVFVYATAADSTGAGYDSVLNMNLSAGDRFDFPAVPVHVMTVSGGRLSAATFNGDLAAGVNLALLPNGAVLFDPTSGNRDIAGHAFLVVDGNGDGVYTTGADYVVELIGHSGVLTIDDFT